jgi:hypothetical protein
MLSIGLLLKKGMKGELDLMPAVMEAAARMGGEKAKKVADGPLAQEKYLIQNFKQLFLMITGNVTQKYGANLEEEQQVLQALADILIEIFFSESALLRTLKNCNRIGIDSQRTQIAMVKNYVFEAQSLISKRLKEVIFHLTHENKEERDQLLDVVHKHAEYIEYPDSIRLKNQIADKLIQENKYCL